jgi:hypothetical protein
MIPIALVDCEWFFGLRKRDGELRCFRSRVTEGVGNAFDIILQLQTDFWSSKGGDIDSRWKELTRMKLNSIHEQPTESHVSQPVSAFSGMCDVNHLSQMFQGPDDTRIQNRSSGI